MRREEPPRLEQWEDIERQLRSELNDAREGYERAKLSLGMNYPDVTHPDATEEYSHALAAYSEAVKRFTDFILKGRLPPG
jgi:hypothetical protein